MRRREFLTLVAASTAGAATADVATAGDTSLECGTWYDGEVTDTTDGDTFDVLVYTTDTEYEVRVLGIDTPETTRNKRYEKTQEWEFIEDLDVLTDWGDRASTFAADELPEGEAVQVKLDCESEETDEFGRLLAKVRYDRTEDGSKSTIYNEYALEEGYARVYAASMSNTDEYLDLQETARSNDVRLWTHDDGSAPEVDNRSVEETFHPHTSSVKTTGGALADSRAPVWAEPEATQDNLGSGAVDYPSGSIPLVGVDEPNNLAMYGGLTVNEAYHEDSDPLEHQVFLSNLIQHLGSRDAGPVLVDGGHHTFNPDHALSGEDVARYQRFLEGVGVELHSINTYGDSTGYSLADARALIVTGGNDAWTSGEVTAVSDFIANGGAVILLGSHAATATQRGNLDALANDLGTDLRLNEDDVHDSTNNVGNEDLLKTANLNTSDFSLFSKFSPSSNDAPTCSIVNPSDGDTVSGTVTIQVDASDSEDDDTTLDVDVAIDGGSWHDTTYNSTSGYYEYDWDTTGVSDGDHTIEARATDSDGATTESSQITVTVDNVASAPTVDSVSLTEVETSDSDAEFDADWSVSDSDGDLSSVDLSLDDIDDGEAEDSATVSVSGDSASGTNRLIAAGEDGSGHTYEVTVTVTDADGNTDTATASTTESENGPSVDSISLTEQNGGGDPHAEFDGDWAVSDPNGDLDHVDFTLTDLDDGETEYSDTEAVSGGSASGTENMRVHHEENSGHTYEFEVTVTDANGNTDTATAEEVEDGS